MLETIIDFISSPAGIIIAFLAAVVTLGTALKPVKAWIAGVGRLSRDKWRRRAQEVARRRRSAELSQAMVLGLPTGGHSLVHAFAENANVRFGAPRSLKPFLLLADTPPTEYGLSSHVFVDLFTEPQSIHHIELAVAVPTVTEQEKEAAAELLSTTQEQHSFRAACNAPSREPPNALALTDSAEDARRKSNRVAYIWLQDPSTNTVVLNIMVWASGIVKVLRERDPDSTTIPLFAAGQLDTSRPVAVSIDHNGDATAVVFTGYSTTAEQVLQKTWPTNAQGIEAPVHVPWPSHLQLRLHAVSWQLRPISYFSRPVAW